MRKNAPDANDTNSTTLYHPSPLRYLLYFSVTSFVILFLMAWFLWRSGDFFERVIILWVGNLAVQFLFRFGLDMVSNKMIIVSADIIAGPPMIQGNHTELQIAEIDRAATNQQSLLQSLADKTTIYDKHGSYIHVNCFYFSPTQLQVLYRAIGCEYPMLFGQRVERAVSKLLQQ